MTEQTPTPAQIKTNHERAVKAAAAHSGQPFRRVTADCQPGRLAVLIVESRPFGSRDEADFTEDFRVQTRADQKIGRPATLSNRWSQANSGTMCEAVDRATDARRSKLDGLRSMERRVESIRQELAEAEAKVAARRAELGL